MIDNQIPQNIKDGYEFYIDKVNLAKTLINSSAKLLLNQFNENEVDKTSYVHVVAVAALLKTVIETIALSSFSAEGEKYIDKIKQDSLKLSDLIHEIEKISLNWLPEFLVIDKNETTKNANVSKEEIKDYVNFLITFHYSEEKLIKINELNWKKSDDISSIFDKFNLIINKLLELIKFQKINLYNSDYFYLINIEDDKVSGSINHK